MADKSSIEWTDATWNPITGCAIKSPGCIRCYAMKLAGTRLKNHPSRAGLTLDTKAGPVWTGEVRLNEQWLAEPIRWKRPRKIFVCAHGDLFAENVPDEWIDLVMVVMAAAPQHVYQVLTKRPERARDYLLKLEREPHHDTVVRMAAAIERLKVRTPPEIRFPMSHVWIGTSVEDQRRADERLPSMDEICCIGWQTWVSYEPAIGAVDWRCWEFVRWIVSGGESGDGARPTDPDWHRATRDFCGRNDIAYNFKQWGTWLDADQFWMRATDSSAYIVRDGVRWAPHQPLNFTDAAWLAEFLGFPFEHQSDGRTLFRLGKERAGRLLDGVEHNQFPRSMQL